MLNQNINRVGIELGATTYCSNFTIVNAGCDGNTSVGSYARTVSAEWARLGDFFFADYGSILGLPNLMEVNNAGKVIFVPISSATVLWRCKKDFMSSGMQPECTTENDKRFAHGYSMLISGEFQLNPVVTLLRLANAKKIVIWNEQDTFPRTVSSGATKFAQFSGIQVFNFSYPRPLSKENARHLVSEIKKIKPDGVIGAAYSPACILMTNEYKQQNYAPPANAQTDCINEPSTRKTLTDAIYGVDKSEFDHRMTGLSWTDSLWYPPTDEYSSAELAYRDIQQTLNISEPHWSIAITQAAGLALTVGLQKAYHRMNTPPPPGAPITLQPPSFIDPTPFESPELEPSSNPFSSPSPDEPSPSSTTPPDISPSSSPDTPSLNPNATPTIPQEPQEPQEHQNPNSPPTPSSTPEVVRKSGYYESYNSQINEDGEKESVVSRSEHQAPAGVGGFLANGIRAFDAIPLDQLEDVLTLLNEPSFVGQLGFSAWGQNNVKDVIVIQADKNFGLQIVYPLGSATANLVYPMPTFDERKPYEYRYMRQSVMEQVWAGVVAFCMLISIVLLIVVVRSRKTKVMLNGSPLFLGAILVGSLLLYATFYTWLMQATTFHCHMRMWLLCIGFAVMFGSLLAKTWRIMVLSLRTRLTVTAKRLCNPKMTNGALLISLACALLLEALLLALWSGLVKMKALPVTTDALRPATTTTMECIPSSASTHLTLCILLVIYNALLLLLGIYMSIRIWNVPEEYNESRAIVFAIYNLGFFAILTFSLQASHALAPLPMFIVRSCAITASTLLTVLSIFGPKVLYLPWPCSSYRCGFISPYDTSVFGSSGHHGNHANRTNHGNQKLASSPKSQASGGSKTALAHQNKTNTNNNNGNTTPPNANSPTNQSTASTSSSSSSRGRSSKHLKRPSTLRLLLFEIFPCCFRKTSSERNRNKNGAENGAKGNATAPGAQKAGSKRSGNPSNRRATHFGADGGKGRTHNMYPSTSSSPVLQTVSEQSTAAPRHGSISDTHHARQEEDMECQDNEVAMVVPFKRQKSKKHKIAKEYDESSLYNDAGYDYDNHRYEYESRREGEFSRYKSEGRDGSIRQEDPGATALWQHLEDQTRAMEEKYRVERKRRLEMAKQCEELQKKVDSLMAEKRSKRSSVPSLSAGKQDHASPPKTAKTDPHGSSHHSRASRDGDEDGEYKARRYNTDDEEAGGNNDSSIYTDDSDDDYSDSDSSAGSAESSFHSR